MSGVTATSLAGLFLDSEDDATASSVPSELAQLIARHQGSLLEVVKASGQWLTSDNDKHRGKAISLLAHVVLKCPKEAVTRQEGRTLAEFFTSSISSASSDEILVPTLEGLAALAKLPSFGAGETIAVCKALFEYIELVGRPQSTRYRFYCLIDTFMAYQRKALKRMGQDFLKGYTTIVTGEKDPRNLNLAFSIARVILVEFDIEKAVEDLFDITFCYFPITFTPPPNDPYGITSEQLQVALRQCLSATPRFGPLALPLFMEKLQASTNTAKKQTLQALVECFPVYGAAVVQSQALAFWEAFSVEVFHATDVEIEDHALAALKAMLQTIYPESDGEHAIPIDKSASVAWRMCDACLLELNDSDKSNATPATKILSQALASSSPLAKYLVPKIFSHILHIYKLPDEIQQRPALFGVTATLFKGLKSNANPRVAESLSPFREELLSIATSGFKVSATRQPALECLIQMLQLPNCLTPEELVFALSSITDLLVKPSGDVLEDVSSTALEGLTTVAALYPRTVEEIVLPPLFQLLPQRAPLLGDFEARDRYRLALASLASLCTLPNLFETFLIRLLSRIEALFNDFINDKRQYTQTVLYSHHIFVTLRVVLQRKVEAQHTDIAQHAGRLLSRLFSLFILPTIQGMDPKVVATEPRLVDDAGRIVTTLVQQLNLESQKQLAQSLQAAFFQQHLRALFGGSNVPENAEVHFVPFTASAPVSQRNLCVLFASAMFSFRKEAFTSSQDIQQLAVFLLRSLVPWQSELRFGSLSRLLSSLFNKRMEDLSEVADGQLTDLWNQVVENNSIAVVDRKAALTVYSLVLRGLILRSDNRAYAGVSRIIGLFTDTEIGNHAARTMGLLSKDNDGVLTKANFAVTRLLYKQRFFSFILPRLVEGHMSSGGQYSTSYLVGLSCLLQSMPKQTTVTELPKLLPLLLHALELPELDLRAHVIDTFSLLVKSAPETIKGQASAIVTALLKNIVCADPAKDTEAGIQLRVSALKCLTQFPDNIDWLTLHQQKVPVLKTLGLAIDDAKKSVRKEAVDCRARWYLFKAP